MFTGPIIFGFILGFILGSRIRDDTLDRKSVV